MTRVVHQHDASATNREYYERPENRLSFRPDGGLDAAETALTSASYRPAAAVLDLGCGNGRVALALAARGFQRRGTRHLAVDDRGGARRRRGGRDRCEVPGRRAIKLPQDENGLDAVVFACNGIGHLTRDGKVACLVELQRVLRPGGVALLSLRTPYALNRMLPRLLRNVVLPRKGLRPDEERTVSSTCSGRRSAGSSASAARLGWIPSASARTARPQADRSRSTLPVGGQFYVVAVAT